MIRRWQLLLAGLLMAWAGHAQGTSDAAQSPYQDRPSRHVLPGARVREIPPQNYKIAPSRAPQSEQVQWRKNGLFDPQQFHQQLQQRQQRTRAPRWDTDITNAATDEMHPVYNPGAAKMFFSSNAGGVGSDGRLINPTPRYRIWRGDVDEGSQLYIGNLTNLTPITGDAPDEQFGSQIQPTINATANLIAYANRSAAGSYNIVVRNLSTGQRVVLTSDNNGITQNLRPTFSPAGNLVIFSSNRLLPGETEADRRYRLYVARADGRPFEDGTFFRRITFPNPGENDVEPAWSPDGNRVAFARIAASGSSYIYMLDFNTLTAVQWTAFVDSNGNRPRDRQPAWTVIDNSPTLIFASTRKSGQPHQIGTVSDRVDVANNIYDIYRMDAALPEPPSGGLAYAMTADPSTAALAQRDVPGVNFFVPAAGAKYPTGAIAERNRIAYHSTRTQGAGTPGPGIHDLWETRVFDLTPPVVEVLPIVSPKESFPGDTVTIKVRAVDLQSGVNFVRVQFKDPDSAEQDAEGLEHRLYQLFQFDIFFPNRILVDQGQAYVPLFVEVGHQAIHPQTYEYKDPYTLVRLGFNGSLDDTLLLQPEIGDNGNPTDWYVGTWRTPDVPSDFYLDVIVRDNAGNEFIYDNITGFTTQQFTGAHNILLVSDYMGGQIFVQNRVAAIGNSITRPTWQPVESYWTDNPTGKPPFDLTQPPSGTPLIIHGDGAIPHPNLPSPPFFVRSDTLGQNTTYGNLYNIWRVQCRNPITPSVLAGYQPRLEREPTDLTGGFRDKLHAPRIVIWASPYAGNVWAGPGHILDPEVQTLIRSFLQSSGRMVFSGQDIAWALSLRGSIANQFMTDILRVAFDSDAADDVFLNPYDGLRHQLEGVAPPQGEDPNPIARSPGGIPIWIRYEGNSVRVDEPTELRLSHPAAYIVQPASDLFDVITPRTGGTGPLYTDAAWNQVWLDTVTVNQNARVVYRYTRPRSQGVSGTLIGTSDHAGSYYADTATRSKVAFLSFGLEGVNSAYNDGPTVLGQGTLWCRSYRNKIIHNAFGWMTHNVLQGQVRQYDPDTRTFTPLPRALVRVIGIQPGSIAGVGAGFAITDSNGLYRIVGLEAGVYLVDAERPGFKTQHPETITLVAQGDPNPGVINLIMLATPPGQISGRVVDINNQPVRGAVVRATNTVDPELKVEVFSDPDGNFLMPRVPVGSWDVTVVSLAFGGYSLPPARPTPDGVYRNVQVQSGQTTNLDNFVLEPEPGTVTGTVTDAGTGQPIANARVTAVAGTNTRADVTTDANGQYTFTVPAGEYVITAVAPGYAPESQTLNVPANQTTTLNFQLSLLPPGSASGKITRRFGGAPEPGVTVELRFGAVVVQTTTTDSNGNYSFPNVPPGEYVVVPIKTGFTFIPNQRTITVNSAQNTVVGEFKSEPLRTFFKGRFLVSAPYDYTQDVKTLLDVPVSATFRFFSWDPAQSRYVFYPNAPANRFQLGRGYFLETSEDLPLTTQGTPANTSQPFQIPLQAGWNLIGNPFTFDVNWSQVQVVDPDTNTPVSLATAVGKGIVANSLWGYSFGTYTATTRMKVWEGYWLYAYRATTLIIPPTAQAASASSRSVGANAGGWRLTLEVQSGDLKDRAYVGVSRVATPGYDSEHDLLKPPPVGSDYVHISLPRLGWGEQSGVYGVDIQPATRSASWEFVVETSQPNREVTLRWPDMQQLPRSANFVLVNLDTGERRYLRTTGAYTFRTSTKGVSRFRIETASSGGLLRIQQVQVSSGRGNQHTVAFQLTGDATVQVNILSGGKVVRQLFNQATRSGGVQQATWDGRDQSGVALPPGAYTIEIRAVSEDGQVARATAPLILTR
ncbi:MAG: carboxypeptidase regulatory-like domain-containing protein [Fimbriimonadales bacterium]|nr:carboxypeptidase regulatory-like domain-containing protein [Fimbriimonadales bacterium]